MNGDNKKGIRRRINILMSIVVAGIAVCGAVAIFSLLFLSNESGGGNTNYIFIIIIAAVSIITAAISLALLNSLAGRIQRPLSALEKAVHHVTRTGNIKLPESILLEFKDYIQKNNDEISNLIMSYKTMLDDLQRKVDILKLLAQGDLRHVAEPVSDEDYIIIAINEVVTNLSIIVRDVISASEQLTVGANELSFGAQSLSQSASEQSATMDQLHETAGEIASKAADNAASAAEASRLTAAIRANTAEVGKKMAEMTKAIKEINTASHAISSVMKAIDEIAFQTNILALNAAVEAARAGAHGRGFAVVADEVRNLAKKSGSAANHSNALIADTVAKSDMGTQTVCEAIAFFKTIEDGIVYMNDLLGEIAKAAKNQSDVIEQINRSIMDMTEAVYQNSAMSKQSAAASEQMNSQAILLREAAKRFLIDNDGHVPEKTIPVIRI